MPVPALSLVIPLHNEASFAPGVLPGLLAALPDDVEVLLVENGSKDGTAAALAPFAAPPRVRLLSLPTASYGGALRAGLEAAAAPIVVNEDVDLLDVEFVELARTRLQDADVLIASKRAAGARDDRGPMRRLVTWGFATVLRVLFSLRATDTHGLKAFRRDAALRLLPRVGGGHDTFDTELIIRAERAGMRIVEVPAAVREQRATRSGAVWKRVPRTLRQLWRLRLTLWREGREPAAR